MPAAALALLALTASPLVASSRASTCQQDSELIWVQPATAEGGFAPESVFRALVGGGSSPSSSFTVELTRYGEPVAATVTVSTHPGESRYEQRHLYTLVPAEPLDPGVRYALNVRHESGEEDKGASVSTLVEEQPLVAFEQAPALVVERREESEGAGEPQCDFGRMLRYPLVLVPAGADASGRSVLHIYRTHGAGQEASYVRAQRVPSDGAALSLELVFPAGSEDGDCFYAVQEDAWGQTSEPSAVSCAPTLLQPSDDGRSDPLEEPPGGRAPGTCSTAGGMAGFLMVWAAALAVASRRED